MLIHSFPNVTLEVDIFLFMLEIGSDWCEYLVCVQAVFSSRLGIWAGLTGKTLSRI